MKDTLIASAGCCAMKRPPKDGHNAVRRAVEVGKEAAHRDHALPLAVLLDMEALLRGNFQPAEIGNRGGVKGSPHAQAYNDKLREIYRQALKILDQRRADDKHPYVDYLPLLLERWPRQKAFTCSMPELRKHYDELFSEEDHQKILAKWGAPRSWDPIWNDILPEPKPAAKPDDNPAAKPDAAARPPIAGTLLSQVSTANRGSDAHDRASSAAQLYVDADDWEIWPDQIRRIRRLKQTFSKIWEPVQRTPEDLDPFIGLIPYSVLARKPDIQVESDIVNRNFYKINDPSVPMPPPNFNIHLCVLVGYASSGATHNWVKSAERQRYAAAELSLNGTVSGGAAPRKNGFHTFASTAQGLTALLLDDWREALRGMRVRFFLHRAWTRTDAPEADANVAWKPGVRWKDHLHVDDALLPAEFAGRLFRRYTDFDWAHSSVRRDLRKMNASGRNWYCCVVPRHELTARGFRSQVSRPNVAPTWIAPGRILPAGITQLLVVDTGKGAADGTPETAQGIAVTQYRLREYTGRSELSPIPRLEGRPSELDLSFINARISALDMVLDALENRARS